MHTVQFDEGIEIQLPEDFEISDPQPDKQRSGANLRFSGAVDLPSESLQDGSGDMILEALKKSEMDLVKTIRISPKPASATRLRNVTATESTARLNVDLTSNEDAVVLLEQDGMYVWKRPEPDQGQPVRGTRKRGITVDTTDKRLVFEIEVVSNAPGAATTRNIFGKIKEFGLGIIKAYVLKFAASKTVALAMDLLEKDIEPTLVHMAKTSPDSWKAFGDLSYLDLPKNRAPKILLFVHGTFSNTVGGFGALGGTPWGEALLNASFENYDAVIGFDHLTLKEDPLENARQLLDQFNGYSGKTIVVDIVTHSRGSLVVRSLIEKLLPQQQVQPLQVNRVVFVGSTNEGTLLAEPGNWENLIDLYTNLVVGTSKVIGWISPQTKVAATIVSEIIKNIGSFVKYCAGAAISNHLIPGLAAMEPDGAFIKDINLLQNGQPDVNDSYYCIITSDFKPTLTGDHEPKELPKRLLAVLGEGFMTQLMKEANDLVVNTKSMGAIDAAFGDFVKERYDFGRNTQVYHTNYFTRPEVANALARWLQLKPAAPKSITFRGGKTIPRAKIITLPPLPAYAPQISEIPPAIDTDILLFETKNQVEDLRKQITRYAPSYVVLTREMGNQQLNYAFKGEEVLNLMGNHENISVLDAFGLHEGNASGTRKVSGETVTPSKSAGNMPSELRNVVVEGNTPIGVVGEEKLPDAHELAAIAQTTREPNTNEAGRIVLRRTMPTFSQEENWITGALENHDPEWFGDNLVTPKRRIPEYLKYLDNDDSEWFEGNPKGTEMSTAVAEPGFENLAEPIKKEQSVCHIHAEMDAEILVNKPTTLVVTVSREAIEKAISQVSAGGVIHVEESKKLIITVIAKKNFSIVDQSGGRAEIDLPSDKEPAELYFTLRATGEGPGEIWVVARQTQVPLLKLVLSPVVVATQNLSGKKMVAEKDGINPKPLLKPLHQLWIEDSESGGEVVYKYVVYSEGLKIKRNFTSRPIIGNREAYVSNLYKKIEDRWVSSGADQKNFSEELRAFGTTLLEELIPKELQKVLWDRRNDFDSIQVISAEPFIPWELIHLKDPGKKGMPDETKFLGQMGLVRWLEGAGKEGWPPEEIKIREGKVNYVIPHYPHPDYVLPEAENEKDFLEKEFGALPVTPESGNVRKIISSAGQFDLLHFACHGVAEINNIQDASLLMEGRIEAGKYILDSFSATIAKSFSNLEATDNNPVVVLNACQAGRAGYKLTGIGGFADAFLSAGAGAFIGTLWSVGDSPARTFTETLYLSLKAGNNLAEATIKAREAARQSGEATWLSYVVYGHPHMVIRFF